MSFFGLTLFLVDDEGYIDILSRTDKFGGRVSQVQGDVVELENNLNIALMENRKVIEEMEDYDAMKKAQEEGKEIDMDDRDEDEEEKYEEREKRRQTSLANLRKRINTRRVDKTKLTYITKDTFYEGEAVFADLPTNEEMLKIKRHIGYQTDSDRKRGFSFSLGGFKNNAGVTGTFEDINKGYAKYEVELLAPNKKSKQYLQEEPLEEESVQSEARSELTSSMLAPTTSEDYDRLDRKAIVNYIIDNRQVTNDIVRSAEIDNLLFQSMSSRPFPKLPLMTKIISLLNLPISILTYLTVLPTTPTGYTKQRYILNPIFGGSFLFFITSYGKLRRPWLFISVLLLCIAVSVLFGFVLTGDRAPTGKLKSFFITLGFLTSFAWMFFLSDLLLCIIQTLNILFNYHYTFMMISAFSFWVWIPMSIASVKVVSLLKEMPRFGGVIFNCFFVFGMATLLQGWKFGPMEVKMWPTAKTQSGKHIFAYICLNFLTVLGILGMVKMSGMRFKRVGGYVLIIGYFGCVLFTFVQGIFAPN